MSTVSLVKQRHSLIPGGAHTYSKGDDQFPSNAPKVILKGKGAYVWGDDGTKYLDWCMGLRSVSLGHVNEEVNRAVQKQMEQGTNFGRPHIKEVELAEYLVRTLPHIDMVKFAKNGSSVTTAAIKLARAHTGRSYVAYCKEHPFFSYDDWFIGTTVCHAGVPKEISNLSVAFHYNDIQSVKDVFKKYNNKIACVIMEVVTTEEPTNNFLLEVQKLCKKNGALFIIDEMITGFRFAYKGAVAMYTLNPDLVTYGKGIANGYSLAVLGGKRSIMERGGITSKKERVFLMSTTHGAETLSLTAALATLHYMKAHKVHDHFWKQGNALKQGIVESINDAHVEKSIAVVGFAPNISMTFKDVQGNTSPELKTIFLQELIKQGILFQGYFAISYAHGEKEIKKTITSIHNVLKIYKEAYSSKNYRKYLVGPAVKPVFRKWN